MRPNRSYRKSTPEIVEAIREEVAHKAITQGDFWPYMHADAKAVVRKCEQCQKYGKQIHVPASVLHPILSPWPFAQWGIDGLKAPLPNAPAKKKCILVATDYFTRWSEVVALANVTGIQVRKFLWEHIVCRFGIPRVLISDNATAFKGSEVTEFCESYNIRFLKNPYYPQGNGMVEATALCWMA